MGDGVGFWSLLFTGDWIARLTMLILVSMSALSWAVIAIKWIQFRKIRIENEYFQESFQRKSLKDIAEIARKLRISPLARMYEGSYREVNAFRAGIEKASGTTGERADKLMAGPDYRERLLERLLRTQEKVYNDQGSVLERRLPLLAIVAAAAPFIGLYGTVHGISGAFRDIGISGVTSLVVVAPGISEALSTTAAGLVAAIPALIAHNIFRSQIRTTSLDMKNHALDITNRLDKIL